MAVTAWTLNEVTATGTGLPLKVKVENETGGAWLLYDSGTYGPAFAWMPNDEGVLNFLVIMGAVTNTVTIDQTAFNELTDSSKWGHLVVTHGKP